ncbi:MAG TPA: hypothetical protein VK616_18155 [Flavitalea sp.]|nr:hypothetical protein [Flavitalea sp.]HTF30086.1 hypothetical protein [Flavitalea sp.]
MLKNLTLTPATIASVGEEIGLQLGNEMVNSYQMSNPNDTFAYEIGRNIIDQILAQPGCAGIKFYNAYNEIGQKTLVYVGLDSFGKTITKVSLINSEGELITKNGIVADRIKVPGMPIKPGIEGDVDDWGWTID